MRTLYACAAEARSASCKIEGQFGWDYENSDINGAQPMNVWASYFDKEGKELPIEVEGSIWIAPTDDSHADVFVDNGQGKPGSFVGTVDFTQENEGPEIAARLLAARIGMAPEDKGAGVLEKVAHKAEVLSYFDTPPELQSVEERVLWDSAWYDDVENFAADFEAKGGDPIDHEGLVDFVAYRLAEDFDAFSSVAQRASDDTDAFVAHNVMAKARPWTNDFGYIGMIGTGFPVEFMNTMNKRLRVTDLHGDLRATRYGDPDEFGRSKPIVSYEFRKATPEVTASLEALKDGQPVVDGKLAHLSAADAWKDSRRCSIWSLMQTVPEREKARERAPEKTVLKADSEWTQLADRKAGDVDGQDIGDGLDGLLRACLDQEMSNQLTAGQPMGADVAKWIKSYPELLEELRYDLTSSTNFALSGGWSAPDDAAFVLDRICQDKGSSAFEKLEKTVAGFVHDSVEEILQKADEQCKTIADPHGDANAISSIIEDGLAASAYSASELDFIVGEYEQSQGADNPSLESAKEAACEVCEIREAQKDSRAVDGPEM